MLHHNKNKQLGRERNQRNALIKSLAISLVKNGKIETTEVKAKVLKRHIEKLITKGRVDSISTLRLLTSKVGLVSAKKIVREISPKYKTRTGGYTRVIKLNRRKSDGAEMAIIEFV